MDERIKNRPDFCRQWPKLKDGNGKFVHCYKWDLGKVIWSKDCLIPPVNSENVSCPNHKDNYDKEKA